MQASHRASNLNPFTLSFRDKSVQAQHGELQTEFRGQLFKVISLLQALVIASEMYYYFENYKIWWLVLPLFGLLVLALNYVSHKWKWWPQDLVPSSQILLLTALSYLHLDEMDMSSVSETPNSLIFLTTISKMQITILLQFTVMNSLWLRFILVVGSQEVIISQFTSDNTYWYLEMQVLVAIGLILVYLANYNLKFQLTIVLRSQQRVQELLNILNDRSINPIAILTKSDMCSQALMTTKPPNGITVDIKNDPGQTPSFANMQVKYFNKSLEVLFDIPPTEQNKHELILQKLIQQEAIPNLNDCTPNPNETHEYPKTFNNIKFCSPVMGPNGKKMGASQQLGERKNTINLKQAKDQPAHQFELSRQTSQLASNKACIKVDWERKESFLLVFQDLQKQNNQLKQIELNQQKDETLYKVCHDLKQPLSCVMNYIQLSEEQINISQYNMLSRNMKIIKQNCELQLYLIKDILDFSRISEGKFCINKQLFKIRNLINDVTDLFKYQFDSKNLCLSFKVQNEQYDKQIFTDKIRLIQILVNLIGNALKFTQKGGVDLSFEFQEHGTMKISVTDSGIGISEDVLNQLFVKFGTFNPKKGLNTDGLGLGLVICKQLVAQLGASNEISVTSKVGEGSSFSFTIDIFVEENTTSQSPLFFNYDERNKIYTESQLEKYQLPKQQQAFKFINSIKGYKNVPAIEKKRIMVVDDCIFNLIIFKDLLEQILMPKNIQFEIQLAYNGQEACNLIQKMIDGQELPYQIIFMDNLMPVLDGIRAIQKIKQMISNLPLYQSQVNYFLLTGCYDPLGDNGKSSGVQVIEKPIQIQKLAKLVQICL